MEQFADNWQQNVLSAIEAFTKSSNTSLSALTKEQRSALVRQLYAQGLFNYRDAAAYIAKLLGVTRATVYNYVKEGK